MKVIEKTPRHDIILVTGDMNAKVGGKYDGEQRVVGQYGLHCDRNDNGERFVSFCAINNLAIASTMFPHKDIHLHTWTSPNGQHHNQIDHVAVNGKFKRSVIDCRTYRGADVGSDHNLIIIKAKLKLHKAAGKVTTSTRYETCKLKTTEVKQQFMIELRNRFSTLSEQTNDDSGIESRWNNFKEAYNDTSLAVLGYRRRKNQEWISEESWKRVEERRSLKNKIDGTKSERVKDKLRVLYSEKDKEVKRNMRKDKRQWLDRLATEAETAANQGNMKGVYDITKQLCNERPKSIGMVKSKNGNILTKDSDIKKRWKEHFDEILNRPDPSEPALIDTDNIEELNIDTGPPTIQEIKLALREMKSGKAPGIDNITTEILKADIETTVREMHKLIGEIWVAEEIPQDWKRGVIIKLAKKGDLTNCGNWRGITLIVTTAKIMGKVIIRRIANEVDKNLRSEQAGFRAGRGTTEQIYILRNILEQAIEWKANLYVCFVDYEKAFDSVHRDTLWKIMKSYGIPQKLISMIRAMYDNSECAVLDENGTTEWFTVKSGVKQGCNMSGFLFLLVIDWIMKATTNNSNTGIRWNLTTKLEDLDYADDIALLSSNREQIQQKTILLNNYSKTTGLNINSSKTKLMRLNANNTRPVEINGKIIEDVNTFVYLGATINTSGGADEDIRRRLGLARLAFHTLTKIWTSNQINRKTKLKIYHSNVLSVLLYGAETWKMTKGDEKILDTFLHKCLRKILRIFWPEKVTNEKVRELAGTEKISDIIRTRRWRWIGHVLRMAPNCHARVALGWTPEGKRKRGRPKETWRRTVEKEMKYLGFSSWSEAAKKAEDRMFWRGLVHSPILHLERRN